MTSRELQDLFDHGGRIDLAGAVWTVPSVLTCSADDVEIVNGTIRADDDATFETLLTLTGDRPRLCGVTLDVNGATRSSAVAGRMNGLLVTGSVDADIERCRFVGAYGGDGIPGYGLALTNVEQAAVRTSRFVDCGIAGRAADGLFCRGDAVVVSGCFAENCHDTGFVLEGCNYSRIVDCVARTCSAGAGITGSGSGTFVGNRIDGLTIHGFNAGNTGGIQVGLPNGAISGQLNDTTLTNVTVVSDGGDGPAIKIRNVSTSGGTINGVSILNSTIVGAGTQGLLVDHAADVLVSGCMVDSPTNACVQANTGTSEVTVSNCHLKGGTFGFYGNTSDHYTVSSCTIDGTNRSGARGVYFAGTGTNARVANLTVFDCPSGRVGSDAGTTVSTGPTDG